MVKIALSYYPEFKKLDEEQKEKLKRIITKSFYIHGVSLEENPKRYFENLEYLNVI